MLNKRYDYDRKPIITLNSQQQRIKSKVEKKIETGAYVFEKVPCIVCGSTKFEPLSQKDRYGFYFPCVICENCGLVQTNPRMDQESYNKFYDKEYRPMYSGRKQPYSDFFKHQFLKGGRVYHYLTTMLNTELTDKFIVEIGTGAGGSMKYFQDKGNSTLGLDLGTEYVAYGKSKGLNVEVGTIDYLKSVQKKPDIIIYCQVMEHILNPIYELKKVRKYMDAHSLLYIEVPGVKHMRHSFGMDFLLYLQNAHVYHFTLTSLTNVMQKAGFQKVAGDEKISSIWKKCEPNESFISEYPSTLNYLKKIEKSRKNPLLRGYNLVRDLAVKLMHFTGTTDRVFKMYYSLRMIRR